MKTKKGKTDPTKKNLKKAIAQLKATINLLRDIENRARKNNDWGTVEYIYERGNTLREFMGGPTGFEAAVELLTGGGK